MADIEMPQLGETVTEGTITQWFKSVGDSIAQDEVLFEVSTDKVDSEVPSPAAGVITEILISEGETVEVGTVLARVGDEATAAGSDSGGDASSAEAEDSGDQGGDEAAAEASGDGQDTSSGDDGGESPAPAPESSQSSDSGSDGQADATPSPERQEPAPAQQSAAPAQSGAPSGGGDDAKPEVAGQGRVLSPVVRRLIAEYDIDPDQIEGSGLGGRISRDDVQRYIESNQLRSTETDDSQQTPAAAPAQAPAPQPAAASSAPVPAQPAARAPVRAPSVTAGDRDRVIPLSNIRLKTGEHMVMSKAVAPHTLTAIEVDYEAVEVVRKKHGAQFKEDEGFSLTYLPFISRATIDALREYPHLNASVGDGELIVHNYVNLGIAVDLDFQGLLAPVVRDADGKRMRAVARDISDVARRARSKQLSPDELSGGTFTLTNAGGYGTMMQFPIINQPQVAILSTDAVKRKPVVITDDFGNESIAIHSIGVLALAWDHRAIDGAYAAAFLARVKEIIETREWEAELA